MCKAQRATKHLKKIVKQVHNFDIEICNVSTQYVPLYKTHFVKFKVKDKSDLKALKIALKAHLPAMKFAMQAKLCKTSSWHAVQNFWPFFGHYAKGNEVYVTWYLTTSMKSEAIQKAAKDFASVLDRETNAEKLFAYETENGFKLKDTESKKPHAAPIEI